MTTTNTLKIIENLPIEGTGKTIIQAFTGSGLVASLVSHHLIEKWSMIEKGYVSSTLIPAVGIVRDGVIQRPVRIFESESYLLILSEIGIQQENLNELIEGLFEWYVKIDPSSIVIIGALPTGRPANAEDLRYSIVASDDATREFLAEKGIWTMPQGAVYGSVALSLMESTRSGLSSFAILSHCIATIPDYLAAKKVVEILSVVFDLKIPVEPLDSNAKDLKEHLVEREKNKGKNGADYDIDDFELYDDYEYDEDEDEDDLSGFV